MSTPVERDILVDSTMLINLCHKQFPDPYLPQHTQRAAKSRCPGANTHHTAYSAHPQQVCPRLRFPGKSASQVSEASVQRDLRVREEDTAVAEHGHIGTDYHVAKAPKLYRPTEFNNICIQVESMEKEIREHCVAVNGLPLGLLVEANSLTLYYLQLQTNNIIRNK